MTSYRAIYAYAWDLAETGVGQAARRFSDLGLNTVTIAGSYHAGKFLRPHGKAGKVYFPEDGTVYFNSDPSRYGAIKPVPNNVTVAGVPAKVVGEAGCPEPSRAMDQMLYGIMLDG